MKRLAVLPVLLLLCAVPFTATHAAQQRGRGELLRADYGVGNQWTDVTDRVASMFRGGVLSFRVENDSLGGDPVPGRAKVLRLQVRNRNGQTQELTFREHSDVLLRGFRPPQNSYNNGYPGAGGLQILSGVYGNEYGAYDVTDRLSSQIRGGQLNVRVNNATMGGDPGPGQRKALRVQYAYNGQRSEAIFNEGDTLLLPANGAGRPGYDTRGYTGDSRNRLQVVRATYGSGRRTVDVTNRLNAQIRDGRLYVPITNDAMGGDPSPGERKTLRIQYVYDGQQQSEVVFNEGDTLMLPTNVAGTPGYDTRGYTGDSRNRLQVARATYGSGRRTVDVTNRLNAQIRDGQLYVPITNDAMGGDPAPGERKTLRIQYVYDGQQQSEVVFNEGDQLRLPVDGSTQRYGTGQQGYGQQGYGDTYRTIPSGTRLSIRTNEAIDSRNASVEQRFSATMAEEVRDGSGNVAIPRGADVALLIRTVSNSELVLDIESIEVGGSRYRVSTTDLEKRGREGLGANKRTGEMVGGGAAIGALLGAILGGGKGAAIGAGVGAAGGAGTQVITGGRDVRVPSETVLNFQLDQDLNLRPMRY